MEPPTKPQKSSLLANYAPDASNRRMYVSPVLISHRLKVSVTPGQMLNFRSTVFCVALFVFEAV